MLFDLRSRRRRGVVRIIYIFLALVMVGGLLLVGVGSNNGGILNAFSGNGSSSSSGTQDAVVDKLVKQAEAKVKASPDSAAAWAALFQARYQAGQTGSSVTSAGDLTKSGLAQVALAATAFQKYVSLSKGSPSLANSEIAAGVYQELQKWSQEASAWEYALQKVPRSDTAELSKPYRCLALSAYAAGQTSAGDTASAEALKLTPKLQRLTDSASFNKAKKSKTTAEELVQENC